MNPTLRRLRQKDWELEASLGYTVRLPNSKKQTKGTETGVLEMAR